MKSSAQNVTPELRRWIVDQAQAGHSPQSVLEAMRASGWHEEVAVQALEETLEAHLQRLKAMPVVPRAVPEPLPHGIVSNTVRIDGREVQVLFNLRLPRIVVFGGLLSDEECDGLIAEAQPRLRRSLTVVNSTGDAEVNDVRTSDGMFFNRGESPLCERIEARLAALANWPAENGEGLQVLRYRPGAEYKPHFDYFDPAQPGTPTILRRGGQRVATFVIYLNTPEGGGGTTFPDVGLEVAPRKGHAVFFSYDRPHPSTGTLHGGAPVTHGEKWVATKWLRERRFE